MIKHLYNQPEHQGKILRLTVLSKGCAGNSYDFQFVASPKKLDECIDEDGLAFSLILGIRLFVDSNAVLKLVGSEIDYIEDQLSSQLIVINPNAASKCGCGASFAIENNE